jgi:hypothetical protein
MFFGIRRGVGLVFALALLFGAVEARAEFAVNAFVSVTPGLATVQVYNSYEGPVGCYGSVTAVTASGIPLTENFVIDTVGVASYGYAYVYTTNPYDPFVNGWAQAWCELLP